VEWLNGINYLPPTQKKVIEDLLSVQWLAPFDTTGLEGDWFGLYWDWILNKRPSDLGTWGIGPNGEPQVTITGIY
jgi:hypothetical protein